MDNPFAPASKRKGYSPPPKNNFQRELQEKMYQRKKAGMTADVTPSESGVDSDELGSDNELMAGFNMSSKSKSPGRKSPYNDMNGYGQKQSKADVIFGNKYGSHYEDDEDDLANAPSDLLMTMKKPMVMTGKGGKKQPQQRQKSPLTLREEDEVDADMSNLARYMKDGSQQQKKWQPPSFNKSSLLENDDEQLQRDLMKTKHRPKSPRPGRKTPSDLGSITEERERELDLDMDESLGSGRYYGKNQQDRPTPKPRDAKSTKPGAKTTPTPASKNKPRVASPTTDIFGTSSKTRSKSPFETEKEDFKSFMKNRDKKLEKDKKPEKDKKQQAKSPSIMDMLAGGSSKDKKGGKGGKKDDKNKYLNHDDSDDSIGGEFKRKDEAPRTKSYSKEEPLGRFNPDKQRGSPYDMDPSDRFSPFDPKSRKSPFDPSGRKSPLDSSGRKSPFDPSGRKSPLDSFNRKSPFDKKGGHFDDRGQKSPYEEYDRGDLRRSPLSVKDDRKMQDLHKSKRSQGDGIYERRSEQDHQKKSERDKSPRQKKENPYAKTSSTKDREYDEMRDRLNGYDHRDGDKHHDRHGDRDRYGDRTDSRNKYDETERDRYGYKDRDTHSDYKRQGYNDQKDDRYGRKSPVSREYDDRRRSPSFERREGGRGYNDLDRGFGRDRHVGFEQDLQGPPSLKGKYDRDRHSPDRRDRDEYADRKPSLRKNDRDEYDQFTRQKFQGPKPSQRSRSLGRGNKDDDRESSVCRDVEEDPSKMKKAPTQEEETLKKHKVKSHTKESALLEQVIESVKEEQTKFKPVDPDKSKEKAGQKQRSQSARHRPKPRYAKPVVESFPSSRPTTANLDVNNTHSIRDTVFLEWYKERNDKARKEKEEKLKKEKEEVEKKRKDAENKKLESMASYNAWAENKKDYLHEKQKKKYREERKKEKELEEKEERKEAAKKSFNLWKDDKDAVIHSKEREKKRQEREKVEDEEDKKQQRTKDAKSAYRTWNERKEETIQQKEYVKRQEAAKLQREEQRKKHEREREASKSYDKWMQKKEKDLNNGSMSEKHNRKSMKSRRIEELNETRPAWSPASRTIPFGL